MNQFKFLFMKNPLLILKPVDKIHILYELNYSLHKILSLIHKSPWPRI